MGTRIIVARHACCLANDIAGTKWKGQSKPRREAQRPRTKMAGLLIILCEFIAIDVSPTVRQSDDAVLF